MEEGVVTRREVGFGWFFSIERGPSNDRQRVTLSGNVLGFNVCLAPLREAKAAALRLVEASAEELEAPPPMDTDEDFFPRREERLHD